MTKTKLSQFASLLVLGSMTGAVSAPAHGAMNSSGEIAPWVARAEKTGPVEDSKKIQISVYLSFRNEDALDKLIREQATRGTAEYGRYLTRAQFHARFAPDKSAVETVRAALARQGLTIGHVAASGFYIQATGTVEGRRRLEPTRTIVQQGP